MQPVLTRIRPEAPKNPNLAADAPFSGEFDIRLSEVLTRVAPCVMEERQLVAAGAVTPGTRRFDVFKSQERFLLWLEAQENSSVPVVPWDERYSVFDYLFLGGVIQNRAFERVFCVTCEATFASQSIAEEWKDDDREGGYRLLCPCGHVLAKTIEWFTA